MKLRHIALATLAVFGIAGSASAAQLVLTGPTLANPTQVQGYYSGSPEVVFDEAATQFTGTLDGRSFQTYCTDIFQAFSFNDPREYTRVSGVVQWGAEKAADLGRLITVLGATPDSSDKAALTQAGIWEIINEADRNYSFTDGLMRFNTASSSLVAMALAFDWGAMKATEARYQVNNLYNAQRQDMVEITPIPAVPEPSTYALMAAGLAAVGFMAKRRRPQA